MKARRVLLGMAAVGGLFGVTGFWQQAGRFRAAPDAVQAQAGAADAFQRVWAQPVPDFRAAALSSDGERRRRHRRRRAGAAVGLEEPARPPSLEPGRPRRVPGRRQFRRAAPSWPTPRSTPPRRPSRFWGQAAASSPAATLDGAIWDVHCSDDGNYAGVSTGSHSLYLYTLAAHPALHRWQLDGIGNSLALTPDGSSLTAGTWDGSGVACYTPRGVDPLAVPGGPAGAARADRPAVRGTGRPERAVCPGDVVRQRPRGGRDALLLARSGERPARSGRMRWARTLITHRR